MKKLLGFAVALLVMVMSFVSPVVASSSEKSDQIRRLEVIEARLEAIRNGFGAAAGTYVGLLSIEKEVIAPSALAIGVGGPIRPPSPLTGQLVYGGDLIKSEYHLISYREGLTLVNLVSDSNLERVEVTVGDRFIWTWGSSNEKNSFMSFYLPSREDAKVVLIYRAPAIVGKHLFLSAVYDGGEVEEKG